MKRLVFAVLVAAAFVACHAPLHADPADAVVKISAFIRFPEPTRPWSKVQPVASSGSGIYIGGNRILTNSHVVLYASELYVQWGPAGEKVEAKIQALSRDLDLAVLTVADDKFFEKHKPLQRAAKLPKVKDGVTVFGFPVGGAEMSITKGEISRINSRQYGNQGYGLEIQVSAPINPGNSGGPAVSGDQMIGVVYSRLVNAQNIGYIIPNEEVEYFLNNIQAGKFKGKPRENTLTVYQPLENDTMRRMLKLDRSVQGVAVIRPTPGFPLKEFDIITKIGNHTIDNLGNIQIANGMRVYFLYAVPQLAKDKSVPVTIVRNGKSMEATMPVNYDDPYVIKGYNGDPLSYFVHGPMVFVPAKLDDMSIFARLNPRLEGDNSPLFLRRQDHARFAGEELVVVSHQFRHKITNGYLEPAAKTVKSVNGASIRSLRHLVETLRDSKGEFLKLEFVDDWSDIMVFDRTELENATEQILEDNGIAATRRGSPDLMEVWRKRK
jgi:S1-C subfamily serine protease